MFNSSCIVDKQCLKGQRCRSGYCRGVKPDNDRCVKTADCFQGSFCKDNICKKGDPMPILSIMIFVICILLSIFVAVFLIYQYRRKLAIKKDSDDASFPVDEHKRNHSTQTLDIANSHHYDKSRAILVKTPDVLIQPPFIISLTSPPQLIRSKHHSSKTFIQKNTL